MVDPSLPIRLLHVLGMAVLVGGGSFTWYELRRDDSTSRARLVRFEWVFWGTLGVLFVTGVGNLGAVGAPGPQTRWGEILTAKLALVVALVVASFLRTLLVLRLRRGDAPDVSPVRRLHALTVSTLLAIVALAEVLAHG